MIAHLPTGVTITPWAGLAGPEAVRRQIDTIFFDAAGPRSFASAEARSAFHALWLGDYLQLDPDLAFIAHTRTGEICGYVVGHIGAPAHEARFACLSYFQSFADLNQRFPAHLHINLARNWRSHGIGGALVQRLIAEILQQEPHCPGVHVVTGRDARNVRFYVRNGFCPRACVSWNDRRLLFLGRSLAH